MLHAQTPKSHYRCATCTDTERTRAITGVLHAQTPKGPEPLPMLLGEVLTVLPAGSDQAIGKGGTDLVQQRPGSGVTDLKGVATFPLWVVLVYCACRQHSIPNMVRTARGRHVFLFLWFLFYFLEQMRQNNSWYIWPIADLFFSSNIYADLNW